MVHLAIKVRGIKTWSKLYIAPDLDQTMILGDDWLKNRAQINFCPNQLKIKGIEIPLGSEARGEINIYSADNIQLPPRTTVSYTARLSPTEQPKETLYQVIPTEEVIPGDEEVILVVCCEKEINVAMDLESAEGPKYDTMWVVRQADDYWSVLARNQTKA